ncbi:hypothetical protein SAMN02910456_00919 [Ruminococcaceae bacterium YRB3002]|nr:hypothetical protein SAMN02910456_00919 [Ruminococcaceae bacterium YRB3002]
MSISKRFISVVLSVSLLIPLVSCNKDDGTESAPTGDSEEYIAGNPDYKNTYYSTRSSRQFFQEV